MVSPPELRMAQPPLPPTELIRHATFLQALGRKLLLDDDQIADATQDTLVIGLEQGPRDPERVRGWLAQVFRNAARQRRRSAIRRGRRERTASRGEVLAPTVDVAARRDVMQRVADSVMDLPAPYREVVILRFYDGLPPREIAARYGEPVATVKSRLARALARMRRALDASDRHGAAAWRVAVAPIAAGLGNPGAPTASLATGGIVAKTKLVALAAVVLVVGLGGTFAMLELAGNDDESARSDMEVAERSERDMQPMLESVPGHAATSDAPEAAPSPSEQRRRVEEALTKLAAEDAEKKKGPKRVGGGVAGNNGRVSAFEKTTVSLNAEDQAVIEVIKTLSILTGLNIIVSARAAGHVEGNEITIQLEGETVATALDMIAEQSGLEWYDNDGIAMFKVGGSD